MSAVVSDTHATIWFLSDKPLLSAAALSAMESAEQTGAPVYVPSITLVEITYLIEKGRLLQNAWDLLVDALEDNQRVLTLAPLDRVLLNRAPIEGAQSRKRLRHRRKQGWQTNFLLEGACRCPKCQLESLPFS